MASNLYVQSLDSVFVGVIDVSNGTTEFTRAYSTVGAARAQVPRIVGDRADKFMGKTIRHPHVTDSRVMVATKWEEVK